ncbi:MAG TPA: TolC family protein [Bryobacteraceae bacterium]
MPLLFLFPLLSSAADAPPGLELSLRQAVDLALAPDGNTRMQLAVEITRQSNARVTAARAALLPNLDGSFALRNQTENLASFGFTFPAGLPFTIPTFVGPFTVFDARVTATMNVFDFSTLRRYQASKTSLEASKADRDSTRDQVTQQVARTYLTAVRADDNVTTAKSNVELSDALLKVARNQKDAGTGTGIDVVRAQVQQANDRQRLVVAELDRNQAYLQLSRVIGLDLAKTVTLTDRMSYIAVDATAIDAALTTANAAREDLKAQSKRVDAARLNYSAAKMESLPSVGAEGDIGPIGTSVDNARVTRTVGLSVRIPIWDSGRRASQREDAQSQWKQEQIRLKDLREQVSLDVRLAADALQSAETEISVAKEGLALSEQELAQARRRFENGVASSIEVTDAQTRLQRARDNQIAALYAHNLARIDWFAALGKIETTLGQH